MAAGNLDVGELTAAMKRLLNEAKASAVKIAQIRETAEFLRSRAEIVTSAAVKTAEAEKVDQQVDGVSANDSIPIRLGSLLVKRNMKIGDLVRNWESTAGEVNKKQFCKNVHALGFKASDMQLCDLFDSYDDE